MSDVVTFARQLSSLRWDSAKIKENISRRGAKARRIEILCVFAPLREIKFDDIAGLACRRQRGSFDQETLGYGHLA